MTLINWPIREAGLTQVIQQISQSLQSLHLEQITMLDEELPDMLLLERTTMIEEHSHSMGCFHVRTGDSGSTDCCRCKTYFVAGWLRIAAAYSTTGKTFRLDFDNISTHYYDYAGTAKHWELQNSDVEAVYERASQNQVSS